MKTIDSRFRIGIAILCLSLPVYESFALLQPDALLQWASSFHLLSAVALCIAAVLFWNTAHASKPVAAWSVTLLMVSVAFLDVGMQWVQGTDYLILNMMQPFHVISITTIAWIIGSRTAHSADAVLAHSIALFAPLVLLWGVIATWSPFVAVYAESYGGGDTLVGHGTTCMLAFVASLTLTLRRSTTQTGTPGLATIGMFVFGLTQALLSQNLRFIPLLLLCGGIFDALRWKWPHAHRLRVIVPTMICVTGYFVTLHSTTIIAWDMTTWFGVCILSACLCGALSSVGFRAQRGSK